MSSPEAKIVAPEHKQLLLEICHMCELELSEEVFETLLQLICLNVTPAAIVEVLKKMKRQKISQI